MRVNQILPIIDKIDFTLRAKAVVDREMQSKFDNGKAVAGIVELLNRKSEEIKSDYFKDERGRLKYSVITGQIVDWSA